MPRNGLILSSLLLGMILLIGCENTTSRAPIVVVPNIPRYSAEFQDRLADEIEANVNVPCPPDILVLDCSAWQRAIIDYGYLREQIRIVD